MRFVVAVFAALVAIGSIAPAVRADQSCLQRRIVHYKGWEHSCLSCLKEWAKKDPDGTKFYAIDGYSIQAPGSSGPQFSIASTVECEGASIIIRDPVMGTTNRVSSKVHFLPNDIHQIVKPGASVSAELRRGLAAHIAHLDYIVHNGKLASVAH